MILPKEIKKFADIFSELPGIGPRQAIRLAFRLIQEHRQYIGPMADAVRDLRNVEVCQTCFFPHSSSLPACPLCGDTTRDSSTFMVVEKETDLIAIERSGAFHGQYCIIGALPKGGNLTPEQERRITVLQKNIAARASNGAAKEIIIAFPPSTSGDIYAEHVAQRLRPQATIISRIGRGIPTGGEIEFADDETLSPALKRRSAAS